MFFIINSLLYKHFALLYLELFKNILIEKNQSSPNIYFIFNPLTQFEVTLDKKSFNMGASIGEDRLINWNSRHPWA